MARWQDVLHSFNAGELSPRLRGRTDIDKYQAGADTIKNFIITPEGGLYRRSGTRFVSEVKNSAEVTRLISFIFSTTQGYILEFGNFYMRVYRNEGQVDSGGSPFELATPYASSEVFALRVAQSADTLFIVHEKHAPRELTRTDHTAWTLVTTTFEDGPYLAENATDTTIDAATATGTGVAVVASSIVGINDGVGFLARDVGRLFRGGSVDGLLSGWGIIASVVDTTNITVDIESQFGTSNATVHWSLGAWYEDNFPQVVTFAEQRLVMCGEPNSPQTLHTSMSRFFRRFAPTGDVDVVPTTTVVFADNALDFELGTDQVNDIRYARVLNSLILGTSHGIFPVQASTRRDAVTPLNINVPEAVISGAATLPAIKVGEALVYISRDKLRVRSLGFSFEVDSIRSSDLTRLASHILGRGAVDVAYSEQNDSIVLVPTVDGHIATMTYIPEEAVFGWSKQELGGGFAGGLAEVVSVAVIPETNETHDQTWMIVRRTIDGMERRYVEFMEEPFRQVDPSQGKEAAFMVDSGLTLDGAASSDPATISGATQADPVVITTLLPHNYSNGDHVRIRGVKGMTQLNGNAYEVANKTGSTYELNDFAAGDIDGTAFSAYASAGQSRQMTTAISGLSHLEGEVVDVVGDGAAQPQETVVGGAITIDLEAGEVHVGLHYDSDFKSLKLVPITRAGALDSTRLKRITGISLRLHDSMGGLAGPDADNLDPIIYREPSDPMTQALEPESDDFELTFEDSWEAGIEVFVRQSLPLPFTLLALVIAGDSGDL